MAVRGELGTGGNGNVRGRHQRSSVGIAQRLVQDGGRALQKCFYLNGGRRRILALCRFGGLVLDEFVTVAAFGIHFLSLFVFRPS